MFSYIPELGWPWVENRGQKGHINEGTSRTQGAKKLEEWKEAGQINAINTSQKAFQKKNEQNKTKNNLLFTGST